MKVLHVISSVSRDSGGPARSSQGLVAAECCAGVDAWIYSFDGADPWIEGVRRFKPQGEVLGVEDFKQFNIVHIHGIWDPRLHQVAVMCRAAKVPYIIAPRGMLEPWSLKQKWFKKRIARFLYQDKDLKCAAALHATAESEAAQFRKLGFKNSVIISPNGVNVPKGEGKREEGIGKRVLFLSRMHPKKGVLELVEAIKRVVTGGVEEWRSKWRVELVYTVNGDFEREYEAKVKAKVKELGLEDQFIFTGPLNDEAKWEAYRRADLFVLPTYSENFGIVVAEALWAGVPVITTKGTPWRELETEKCGWWIDLPAEGQGCSAWNALDAALSASFLLPNSERIKMGQGGRKLVEDKYTWEAVCAAMTQGYKEVLNA